LRVCSCAATRRPPEVNASHRQPIERSSLVLGRGLSTWDRAGAHRPLHRTFRQGATQVVQLLSGRKSIPNWPQSPRLDFPYWARSHSAPIPSSDSDRGTRKPPRRMRAFGCAHRSVQPGGDTCRRRHPLGRWTDAAMHFQSWAIPPTRAEGPRFGEARDPEEFERAIAEAKAEGNLSRANVVRYGAILGPCASPCRPADGPGT